MALIDITYFVGELNIPNTNKTEVSERLTWFIDKYQPKLLRDLFGYEMSKAFEAGIVDYDSDGSNPTISERWLNLVEGAEYTRSSRLHKFEGLPDIIARYVYWHWISNQHTQTVGLGEVATIAENAEAANPADKMITAWNEMSDMIEHLYYYLKANDDVYPELVLDYCAWRNFEKQNHWGF